MPSLDQEVNELYEKFPILADRTFNIEYPGIGNAAGFLESSFNTHKRIELPFKAYQNANIRDTGDFLEKLKDGNEDAYALYGNVKKILHF